MHNSLSSIQASVSSELVYPVHFTHQVFAPQNPLLAQQFTSSSKTSSVLILVDQGVWEAHPALSEQIQNYQKEHLSSFQLAGLGVLPGGEEVKSDRRFLDQVYEQIQKNHLCRHSYILAIGGGAFLDLVGYAAATAHRGIRLIRMPSTTLAQNDAGIGVKNGVNAFEQKNFLGTFAVPYAVINDFSLLSTLSDRDWRSGIAEAIKVGLLKDEAFFEWIESHHAALEQRHLPTMQHLIHRCAQLHLSHITQSGDPFEQGSSRPLDFGHWAAHKLEMLSEGTLRHGEAVAIGIALDCTYAWVSEQLSHRNWTRILSLLQNLNFELMPPVLEEACHQPAAFQNLFQGLNEFREHLGGMLSIPLIKEVAHAYETHEVNEVMYHKALCSLKDYVSPSPS